MRRIVISLVLGVVLGATLVVYIGTRGDLPPTALGVTLTAQTTRPGVVGPTHWRTTRRISLSCGDNSTVTGSATASARALCKAVAYYAHHLPEKPCVVLGYLAPRVVITGSLDGRPLRFRSGRCVTRRPP